VRAASELGDNLIGVKLVPEAFAPEGVSLTGHDRRRRRKGRADGAVCRRDRFLQESALPTGT
jgi:hypothetical protein